VPRRAPRASWTTSRDRAAAARPGALRRHRACAGGPTPFTAAALRGQVVDADTGKAIEGAVLLARWNWRQYFAGFHSGPSFDDRGETLKVSEAVSDAQGRFTLAGFGPTVRGMGKLEERAPSLTVFKSGYVPFQRNVGTETGTIRLKRHEARRPSSPH
jgi:hypothetical protein